jgi:hypothetical protein
MIKQFTTLQLFSIIDGRLSTTIDDVYDILNHVCNDELMTHHLPVAMDYLRYKNPKWFVKERARIEAIKARLNSNTFETVIGAIKDKYNETVDVSQLKDEFNTEDFGEYMVTNSLLIKKLNN